MLPVPAAAPLTYIVWPTTNVEAVQVKTPGFAVVHDTDASAIFAVVPVKLALLVFQLPKLDPAT